MGWSITASPFLPNLDDQEAWEQAGGNDLPPETNDPYSQEAEWQYTVDPWGLSEDLELDPAAENGPPHPHLQSGPLDPLELPLSPEWLLEEEKQ